MRLYEFTPNRASKTKAWIDLDSVVRVDYVTGASAGDGLLLTFTQGSATVGVPDEIKEVALILGIKLP